MSRHTRIKIDEPTTNISIPSGQQINTMTTLIAKFNALFTHERTAYVNAARVNDIYKRIERGANQVSMINALKLDYIIVARRGKDAGAIINVDINSDQFKPSVHNVFVKLDQLSRCKRLAKLIKALPNINMETVPTDTQSAEENTSEPQPVAAPAPHNADQ